MRPFIITRIINETPSSKHLEWEVSSSFQKTYTTAGQWIQAGAAETKPAIFALTGEPSHKKWSILVKNSSPLTQKISQLKEGDSLLISDAQGKGFDMSKTAGKNIFLFAVGSGIAPIRAALLWMFKHRNQFEAVTLYYGARNPNEFAYQREFDDWKKRKVKIIQTISNMARKDWQAPVGYVQNLIPRDEIDSANTVALVCGMSSMIREVTSALRKKGMSKESILTNF